MKGKNRLLYKPPPVEDYSSNFCKLYIVIGISFVFIAGQFVGGYISGSISVISDAFHLVTDLIGFGISYVFIYFSRKEPTEKMSFGYHRMELLGALGNLFIIWFLAIFMIYEATIRIINKQFVTEPLAMLIVGVGGLAINIIMYFVLHSGSHSHGLMSEPCDHHHEPHDNDPNPSNCTTSFCNELICDDLDCLKQINYSHCHPKDPKGDQTIHRHDPVRKDSDPQFGDVSLNKLNDTKSGMKNNNESHEHEHEHEHDHDHENQHSNGQQNTHNHKHGQNCKHNHGSKQEHKPSYELSPVKIPPHKHTQKCQHSHETKVQQKKQTQHKHGEGCKHDHNHKDSHDHKHDHKQDHSHGHGHDHDIEEHGHQYEHHESISMKAAVLHALSDVIQSIGLLISSLFIFFLGSNKGSHVQEWNDWHYFDPISTYIFSVIVVCSTIPIVKNCYYIIMESTPSTETARELKREFEESPGVVDVHDLHIWNLRPGKNLLIAHVFAKEGAQRQVLTNLTQICRKRRIFHSTLQVEQVNWKNHDEYILCDHDIH